MAGIDAVRAQLATASSVVASQQAHLDDATLEQHARALAEPLTGQLANLRIDYAAANYLNADIQQSLFSPAIKQEIIAFIGQRVIMSTSRAAAIRRMPQTITNPNNIFTKSDWEFFNYPGKTQGQLISRAVQRLFLLGFTR